MFSWPNLPGPLDLYRNLTLHVLKEAGDQGRGDLMKGSESLIVHPEVPLQGLKQTAHSPDTTDFLKKRTLLAV